MSYGVMERRERSLLFGHLKRRKLELRAAKEAAAAAAAEAERAARECAEGTTSSRTAAGVDVSDDTIRAALVAAACLATGVALFYE